MKAGILGEVIWTTLLLLVAGTTRAVEPVEPLQPTSAKQCAVLSKEYYAHQRELSRKFSATPASGRQVSVGACCAAENPNNAGWCRMHASVAPLWEEIHCVSRRKDQAVKRCMATVRSLAAAQQLEGRKQERDPKEAARERASEQRRQLIKDYLAAVDKVVDVQGDLNRAPMVKLYVEAKGWYEKVATVPRLVEYYGLAKQFLQTGMPREAIPDFVARASAYAAEFSIHDPAVRELVVDNLQVAQVSADGAMDWLDRTSSEFLAMRGDVRPDVPKTSARASSPATTPAAAPANAVDKEACRRAYSAKVAACAMEGGGDFASRLMSCKSRFEAQHLHCF